MMNILVNNRIRIKNPTPAIERWCKENLVLDNPEYYKKERMGKWTGNTPHNIWLYEKMGDELWLPFGCLRDIWKLCVRGVQWKVEFEDIRHVDYRSTIKPYDYQEEAIKSALKAKNGVLVMPCGSGKTQCGLEIIARIGGRALWLTHTQDLLNQSKKRAESVLGYVGCGTITAGKVSVGNGITFATVQTLSKRIDLLDLGKMFDIVIVDECQHCCGSPTKVTQFYKVVSRLSARYKFGLTATPKRSDGLERGMFALLGGIVHEVSKEAVAHTTCPVEIEQIRTNWFPDCECVLMSDGTIDYHKVVDNMISDAERFDVVSDKVHDCAKNGPTLVLGSRVQYLSDMSKSMNGLKSVCLSGMGQSRAAKEERKGILKRLNDGEVDVVFATYALAKEGLDVPNLRYVVFATPEKDETTVVQSVGRVGRKADGKDHGTVIDFVDDFGMYKGWSKKRQSYYKKIGANVSLPI